MPTNGQVFLFCCREITTSLHQNRKEKSKNKYRYSLEEMVSIRSQCSQFGEEGSMVGRICKTGRLKCFPQIRLTVDYISNPTFLN